MGFLDLIVGYLMDGARWLIIAILALIYPQDYSAWNGQVVQVLRPDEIRVKTDGVIRDVRLYGIDSPLPPQPYAEEAEAYTLKRLLGKVVTVQPLTGQIKGPWYNPSILVNDPYGRIIGLVWVYGEDGPNLSEEFLSKGLTHWYRPFVPFERGYKHLEDLAKEAKAGMWADPGATRPPWKFQHTPLLDVNPLQDRAVEPEQ